MTIFRTCLHPYVCLFIMRLVIKVAHNLGCKGASARFKGMGARVWSLLCTPKLSQFWGIIITIWTWCGPTFMTPMLMKWWHGAYVAPTYCSIMHWECVFPLGNPCPFMGTLIIPTWEHGLDVSHGSPTKCNFLCICNVFVWFQSSIIDLVVASEDWPKDLWSIEFCLRNKSSIKMEL